MRGFAAAALLPVAAAAGPAFAQDGASGDWTVDVGAVGRVRPAHLGSARSLADAVPVLEAQLGDRVHLSFDDGAKWAAAVAGPFAAGPIVEYRQSFNDDLPAGAFRTAGAVEAGGFASVRTPVGVAEARLRRALNGYQGWSGDLSFDTGGRVAPKTLLGAQLRLGWADSNFTEEYFGLRPHGSAQAGAPRFLPGDYVTAGAQVAAARELGAHARLVFVASADWMLGAIRPNPVFSRRDIYTASLGLTYHWVRATPGSVK
jgi:outer membrane scaffolding protein for murein synthesis (MipA/OmpV family)